VFLKKKIPGRRRIVRITFMGEKGEVIVAFRKGV
jgi:hypothetical protein